MVLPLQLVAADEDMCALADGVHGDAPEVCDVETLSALANPPRSTAMPQMN